MSTASEEEYIPVNNNAQGENIVNRESVSRRGTFNFNSILCDFGQNKTQKLAVWGLIMSDFCRFMALRTLVTWLPFIILLYDPLMAHTDTSQQTVFIQR